MRSEKKIVKEQLDKELQSIHFTKKQEVIYRTHPVTWRQKFTTLWNKELEIPLLPLSTVCVVFLLFFGYKEVMIQENEHEEKVLVEVAGNVYWKNELERVLVKYED